MRLSDDETALFYETFFPLLTFVHEQTGLVPEQRGRGPHDPMDTTQAVTLRDRLWEDDALRVAFAEKNPFKLRPECLELARSWQHRVSATFCLFTFHKGRAVFLGDSEAYAVLGLTTDLADMFPEHALPRLVKATLLPFQDRIVSDGLIVSYPILMGPGMRRAYRNDYNAFKARKAVRESLFPDLKASPPAPALALSQIDAMVYKLIDGVPEGRAQEVAFRDKLKQHVVLPFYTSLYGHQAKVTSLQLPSRGGIKAICEISGDKLREPLQELPLPTPLPPGAEWIEAYSRWKDQYGKRK